MLATYYHSPELPWAMPEDEEHRYRRILKRTLLAFLLLALVLPFLPVPQIARERVEAVPPRLAKLILERQPPPAPPVKIEEPELKKPEPKPAEAKKVEPKKQAPEKTVEAARAKAERAGLLALKDDLADLRSHSVSTKLEKTPSVSSGTAAPARAADRALITSNATSGSGGVQTARLSRDTGGGGLAGRATTQVASPVGGAGGGGSVQRGAGGKASRSLEDVKLVFDRNKGSIYTLYNRALRDDPTLQGKLVLKLTISAAGQVTDCQIVSSELRSPELERKLLARIRQFDFGARSVEVMVVTYPIDFLPS